MLANISRFECIKKAAGVAANATVFVYVACNALYMRYTLTGICSTRVNRNVCSAYDTHNALYMRYTR